MIPVYIQVNPKWLGVLDKLHQRIHDLPHDQDDTATVALTRRDYASLLVGLDVLVQFHPCLEPELIDLVNRMVELREAQKPGWIPEE